MWIDFLEQRMVPFPDRGVLRGEGVDRPDGHGLYGPPLLNKPMSRVGG